MGAAVGLGVMSGPFIGGILSDPASGLGGAFDTTFWADYPYLLPCLFSSAMSLIAFFLAFTQLPESLPAESRAHSDAPTFARLGGTVISLTSVLRLPPFSTLVVIHFLFLLGFTMMHGTFILFTSMSPESGGLGWSEMDNGWVFAFIGLMGVVIQGVLIGPLTDRFNLHQLMLIGTLVCGLGLSLIHI